jgi:hypothetical protein
MHKFACSSPSTPSTLSLEVDGDKCLILKASIHLIHLIHLCHIRAGRGAGTVAGKFLKRVDKVDEVDGQQKIARSPAPLGIQ